MITRLLAATVSTCNVIVVWSATLDWKRAGHMGVLYWGRGHLQICWINTPLCVPTIVVLLLEGLLG